jgi:excisionase family DNA binding protein
MPEHAPGLATVKEAAEWLRLHPGSVRRLIAARRIPATKIGHEWRISWAFLSSLSRVEKQEKAA